MSTKVGSSATTEEAPNGPDRAPSNPRTRRRATSTGAGARTDLRLHKPVTVGAHVVDVKRWGAKGDGVTNDTAAIQAAIDTAGAAGATTFFPPGVYLVSTLTLPVHTVMQGAGIYSTVTNSFGPAYYPLAVLQNPTYFRGSMILSTATTGTAIDASVLYQTLSIRDLGIIGPGSGTSTGVAQGTGVKSYWANALIANFSTGVSWSSEDGVIDGAAILGCQTGLKLTGGAPNQNAFHALYMVANQTAISVGASQINTFANCVIQGNTGPVVVDLGTEALASADGVTFTGCYFENSSGAVTHTVFARAGSDKLAVINCHFGGGQDKVVIDGNSATVIGLESPPPLGVVVNGGGSVIIGEFLGLLSGTGNTTAVAWMDSTSSSDYRYGQHNLRINSGGRLYFETVGTNSYIGRDSGTGDTVIGSGSGVTVLNGANLRFVSATGVLHASGAGNPESVVTAPVGSLYTRTDGGAGSTLYVKESGSGNTGWRAV